jgi:SAM-dependent methyltransferase
MNASVSELVPPCPVCDFRAPIEVSDEAPHALYHCPGCDVQFFFPMENPGSAWYEENAQLSDLLDTGAINWNHRQFLRDQKAMDRGSLLDIGCGTGNFLKAAQAEGWEVAGLDFNAEQVRVARERLGVESVYSLSLDQFRHEFPAKQFDAATAFEVLEHVDNPRQFLVDAYGLVKPNGYFAVSLPFRERWPAWNEVWDRPPHHLTRWSKRALLGALARAGFQVMDVRTGWIASRQTLMGRLRLGLVTRELQRAAGSNGKAARASVRRAAAMHRLKSLTFGAMAVPVDGALRLLGATGIDMYALARRPPS